MKRFMIFAKRNFKELLRDPLCYVFNLALPLVLMLVLHFAFYDEKTTFWFGIEILFPGILVFSYAFIMLYMTLLVSQDRATSFLTRLYTSPMRPFDFILGYMLPALAVGFGQMIACSLLAIIINVIEVGALTLSIPGLLLSLLTSIPSLIVYASIGIMFGAMFSDKAAPGVCSAIITASAFLSGAWMVVDELSVLGIICRILPFYPSVKMGRFAVNLFEPIPVNQVFDSAGQITKIFDSATFSACWSNLLIAIAWAAVLFPLAIFVFGKKTTEDNK